MEGKNFTVLCVDDEPNILSALNRLLRKEQYDLLFANSGKEGLEILKENQVQMVISDQRMPGMSGTDFLAIVKDTYPDALRVILTGYSDIDSITESINKGNICKFFFKPWNDLQLKSEIRQILDQQALMQTNRQMDKTILKQNDQLQQIDENIEQMVNTRIHELETKNQMLALSHAILEDLPIAVIGIDIEGVIVTANKMALKKLSHRSIEIGRPFGDFFKDGAAGHLCQVLETGKKIQIDLPERDGSAAPAALLPLSGSFKGKGVIMTMK